ncbi:putative baseplate assembly protein [Arthrobacter sp. N199823]|uniref:putative baseplate assembly protein n=1 Tax=Arthrobacter sp. N199823 TaxID=2058895 RepID=UPI000CE3CBED|nr:putative baseplate assembly protein [Arthrobacter sp. N199823]
MTAIQNLAGCGSCAECTACSGCSGCGGCSRNAPCGGGLARAAAFANRANLNAIDYVEVSDDQRSVLVYFMGEMPQLAGGGQPGGLVPANVRITGGEAVTGIVVTGLTVQRAPTDPFDEDDDGEADDGPSSGSALAVSVDRPGDFSTYTVSLGSAGATGWGPLPGFNADFSQAAFSFKAGCPTGVDCVQECPSPAALAPDPSIDYLAKDYESFRTLMLDRLSATMPGWQERHAADVGIALVEVLAYAADELSYYQDAVATEAYLGTARQRVSVRRHVRLVDYFLHEGLNARAWLTVSTDTDTEPVDARDIYFITAFPALAATPGTVLEQDQLDQLPAAGMEVFEPADATATGLVFHAAQSEISIDTGGEPECRLSRGTTEATLVDRYRWRRAHPREPLPASWNGTVPAGPLELTAGSALILEEVKGPVTGNPADARPDHRQAVRLTSVDNPEDRGWLVRVTWHPVDALIFDLCLSTRTAAPECTLVEGISVARGNTILVDHGRTVTDPPWDPVPVETVSGECCCDGGAVEETIAPTRIAPVLAEQPLTHSDPVVPGAACTDTARDPREAGPAVELSFLDPADGSITQWGPRQTLLESSPRDRAFVAEMDDAGQAHLRFGDGDLGEQPAAGLIGTPRYRVGNGAAGNVGRDSITFMVLRAGSWSGASIKPRNPLPASGGMDRETVAEARLLAPDAFRRTRLRAVTADDYAELAGQAPELQRAAAQLAWTGSWYEARVGVDPWGSEQPSPALLDSTAAALIPYRRMGHDLAVTAAGYVPIEVGLEICVLPHFVRGEVRAELLRLLGSGPDGFFNPDRLTFGTGVYVSSLVALAASVPGVESAVVSLLRRQGMPGGQELEHGVLAVGPLEIVRMDNSPNFPDHGILTLTLGGGL